ncbi:hypothetical protein BD410DRAFT_786558 [Rickenella mellea]|uniref:Glycosyltransferase 61 catalytic domain-containing protein n=1 Tax=Rickenella mellea TaxID=50990 RepID=A0A4Y7QAQ1_9AGAM|nr:hypothetical protein BD410DRAFT_786558 [Rickenella mellea]
MKRIPTRLPLLVCTLVLFGLYFARHASENPTRHETYVKPIPPIRRPVVQEHLEVEEPRSPEPVEPVAPFVDNAFRVPPVTWKAFPPETNVVTHAPGWTVFDNVYALNGTLFVVTSNPLTIPDLKFIISTGIPLLHGKDQPAKRLPTDREIRVITPMQASSLFGDSAVRLSGPSWLVNDPNQYIPHYYHWAAELFLGLWRAYASLALDFTPDGRTSLPPPSRLIFTRISPNEWRDPALLNPWMTRAAFPSLSMEFEDDWTDRSQTHRPYMFERLLVADRSAAEHGESFKKTWRTASQAFELSASKYFWEPVRRNVLDFSGLAAEWVNGPNPGALHRRQQFVVTYISRQGWGRRELLQEHHERLVHELMKLKNQFGIEVNVAEMDKLTRAQQFQLAGRTTIMMGVHGNGLTALLWMRPTPQSTVIEFFCPEGLAFDYEYTTRALGMVHYGVWNDEIFTRPNVPQWPNYPEDFQGTDIPLNGGVVAELVKHRLGLDENDDTYR